MKFKIAALAAGIGLALACDDGPKDGFDTSSTAETGSVPTADLDPFITAVTAQCNSAGNAWEFGVESDNWMFNATVAIFDTSFDPAWDEEHNLDPISNTSPNDGTAIDEWGGSYSDGATAGTFNPNVNSVFDCDQHAGFITYVFEAYNEAGQVADCVVVGHDPNEVISGAWPDNGADDVNGTDISRFSNCININP